MLSLPGGLPANRLRGVFGGIDEIFFDEKETGIMLASKSFAALPDDICKKLWYYDVGAEFLCFSRNLRLMLDNRPAPKPKFLLNEIDS